MKRRNAALIGAAIVAVGLFSATALPAQAETLGAPTVVAPPVAPTTPDALPVDEVAAPVPPAVAPSNVKAKPAKAKHTAVSRPVPRGTRISSRFGHRHAPCWGCTSFHKGLDFNPGYGKPIRAIAAGVVTEANSYGELGVHVSIKHKVDGKAVTSGYGHMQYGSMHLHVGQKIKRGQIIGRVGSTGASTGAHLHFTIKRGGKLVDPLSWLHKHVNH